jgi:hypothetical protein
MATLAIVWRNPSPVKQRRRWRRLERTAHRSLYVLQELISPERNIWVTSTSIEVIHDKGEAPSATVAQAAADHVPFSICS